MRSWFFAIHFSLAILLCSIAGCGSRPILGDGQPASCRAGSVVCGSVCATVASDPANCGACGVVCASGQVCSAGACAASCATGTTACSSACVNLQTDPARCGSCTTMCTASQQCTAGVCVAGCAVGETLCSGACVNLQTSQTQCGACGNVCTGTQRCVLGACVSGCATGETLCNGVCVNLQTSQTSCGMCGTTCSASQRCMAGTCVTGCATGEMLCNGVCVNLQSSQNNCGTCGTVCTAPQLCNAGMCSATCTGGRTTCNGACVDTQTDNRNCGTCGTVCTAPQLCNAGMCSATCTGGRTMCNGGCVDTQTDTRNCGTCGTMCGTNEVCTAGRCGPVTVGTCVNQPAGMTAAGDVPWAVLPTMAPAFSTEGWRVSGGMAGNLSLVSDPSGPQSPPTLLRVRYPQGLVAGTSSVRFESNMLPNNAGEFYACFFIRLGTGFTVPAASNGRLFALRSSADPGLNHGLVVTPGTANGSMLLGLRTRFGGMTPVGASFGGTVQTEIAGPGWRQIEVLFTPNRPGQNNGRFQAWIAGVMVIDAPQVEWFPAGGTARWDTIEFDPIWGVTGETALGAEQGFDLDHFRARVR